MANAKCVGSLLTLLLVVGVVVSVEQTATAEIVRNIEFSVDGVLPSADPDIDFFNNTGFAEASLYSVSGGLLEQRTRSVDGNASYHWPGDSTLDSTVAITMEAKLRVIDIEGTAGAYFQAFDGANRYQVAFLPGAVSLYTGSGYVSYDLDITQPHTYRMVTPGNSSTMNLSVDGSPVLTAAAPSHTANKFEWGDGVSAAGNGANADWDYVRVSQVPEPSSLLSLGLGLGLATLFALRKRRKAERPSP
ncbi:PEP-CTERM sorting domain-containing protein [Planctomycetota bacterium]